MLIPFFKLKQSKSLNFVFLPWWGKCILIWFSVLIVLNCVALIVSNVAPLGDGVLKTIPPNSLPGLWTRWDSSYYLTVAIFGYELRPDLAGFFPLFPSLISAFSHMTGLAFAWSGLIIAQISYLVAMLGMYKLGMLINNDPSYALRCVFYLVLFPTSLFFFAVYAESLYLALAILTAYFLLESSPKYIKGGLVLGFASLTRPVGWLLGIIPVVEFARRKDFSRSSILSAVVGLILAAVGTIVFILYLRAITGSLTAIFDAQSLWKRMWQWPWLTIWDSVKTVFAFDKLRDDWFSYILNIVDLGFTFFAGGLTFVGAKLSYEKKFPWSLILLMAGSLIFLLCRRGAGTPVDEMARWVTPLFPMYLILAQIRRYDLRFHRVMMVISSVLLVGFTAWFASGRWLG